MIDTSNWRYFPLTGKKGLFKIEPCKCSNAGELLEEEMILNTSGLRKTIMVLCVLLNTKNRWSRKETVSFLFVMDKAL